MEKKSVEEIVEILKKNVEKGGYIDIGSGVEKIINTSRTRFKKAIEELQTQGYKTFYIASHRLIVENVREVMEHHKQTVFMILGGPNSYYKEVAENKSLINKLENVK